MLAVAPSEREQQVVDAFRRLERWGSDRRWAGSDPYDGLSAGKRVAVIRRTALGRRVLTQLVKRSPVDLRPALGVPRSPSAAALAHVASSYAISDLPSPAAGQAKLEETLEQLLALRCDGFAELCWGYPFDVQTRVFFYPEGAPNTIATAFAAGALLDAYELTGADRWLRDAEQAAEFFIRHVPQTEADGGAFFGYLVGDRTPIHNANLLVCSVLARVSSHLGRADLAERASAGVAHALAHQRADGSWPYGEGPSLGWVDSFHTGYVLESLIRCAAAGIDLRLDAVDQGLRYYRSELFLPDGTPKYMPDSLYPVDIQSAAQAIQTFSLAADRDPDYSTTAFDVFEYSLRSMRNRDGSFAFQRRRFWINRSPHVRWCEAPMLHALAHLSNVGQT